MANAQQWAPAHYVGPGGDPATCNATNHPCIWTWDWADNNTLLLPTAGWMGFFGGGDEGDPDNYVVNIQI